jgi:putative DNA primase/helicase
MFDTTNLAVASLVPCAQIKPETEDAGITTKALEMRGRPAADGVDAGGDPATILPQNKAGQAIQVQNPAPRSGSGGPAPLIDTHSAIADTFETVFANERKYAVDLKEWLTFSAAGVWQTHHILLHDIEGVAKGVAQQILASVAGSQGAQRNRSLLSTGTWLSIKTTLQSRPAMITRSEGFDADPRMLNTPDFVFNLETGETHEHSAQFLMRQQTLVTPDLMSFGGGYPTKCPRFLTFLEIIADGRSWVIPFLQRWFGYCLTGKIGHQHFLFLQGLPGTGKSQLITILVKLMHTYATILRESFMTKGRNKRFDMVNIVGKRLGFNDETMLGSTWDETRMSNVAGAERLSAEIKGGREFDFPNRIKLIVAGNHRPNFVSGETGGLLRRMLLLEMTNRPVTQTLKVEENFAHKLVEAEGAAILMWAIEGAMLDYADTDNMIFDSLKQPMVDAAKAYTRENSPFWSWMEEHCTRGPEHDMDLVEAFEHFKDYVWRSTHDRCRVRRTDFRAALKAMLPEIEFVRRTTGQFKGRMAIRGLGFTKVNWAEAANVVDINEKRAERPGTQTS